MPSGSSNSVAGRIGVTVWKSAPSGVYTLTGCPAVEFLIVTVLCDTVILIGFSWPGFGETLEARFSNTILRHPPDSIYGMVIRLFSRYSVMISPLNDRLCIVQSFSGVIWIAQSSPFMVFIIKEL